MSLRTASRAPRQRSSTTRCGHADTYRSWARRLIVLRDIQKDGNDLGGTLMNENISRAAGASHGQEVTAQEMKTLITGIGGRTWARRSTIYEILETEKGIVPVS